MEKIKNLAPYLTLLAFLSKTMLIPASIADALIISALVLFIIADQYRLKDKKLAKYDEIIAKLQENQQKTEIDLKNTQASINSVKLGFGVRTVNGQKL